MKLSTRTTYTMLAILELAEHFGKGPLQTKVIAKHQDIPVKYLEQLMVILKSAGLIKSLRGSKGGYILAQPPEMIKLSEVFDVLEGPVITVECIMNESSCARAADCMARPIWSQVHWAVTNILRSMTLQDALDKAKKGQETDYQI